MNGPCPLTGPKGMNARSPPSFISNSTSRLVISSIRRVTRRSLAGRAICVAAAPLKIVFRSFRLAILGMLPPGKWTEIVQLTLDERQEVSEFFEILEVL